MKIKNLLLSSVAATAVVAAVAGNAVTSVSDVLVRDADLKFTEFGSKVDTLTMKGLPTDNYKVAISAGTPMFAHGEFQTNKTLEDATWATTILEGAIDDASSAKTKDVYVKYTPNALQKTILGAFIQPETATLNVEIADHCNDAIKFTKEFTVKGYLPGMSFENNPDIAYKNNTLYLSTTKMSFDPTKDIKTEKTIYLTQAATDTLYFVMGNYAGAAYQDAAAKVESVVYANAETPDQISCTVEKVTDTDTKVNYLNELDEKVTDKTYPSVCAAANLEGQLYRAIVKYAPAEGGNLAEATITIADGIELNSLKLNVVASDAQIAADVEKIDFPEEGGKVTVNVDYTGFEGEKNNKFKQIKAYMASTKAPVVLSTPFKPMFQDSQYGIAPETLSAELEGSGTLLLDVECAAIDVDDITSVSNDVLVIEINDKKIEIPVTRTNPYLMLTKTPSTIVFGEEIDDVKKEVSFAVTNFINFYNSDDLFVYTDDDAFRVYEVSRIHKGILMEPNKDYELTVTILFQPYCDNKDAEGNLIIKNKKTDDMLIVPLKGIAPVNAKGYTGVENVNAATAAGAAYNVAGAAVNANAKGIVVTADGQKIMK